MSPENHDHDTKSDRQIIQIAVAGERLHALCSDGTVWWIVLGQRSWTQLSPIPQGVRP